MTPKEKATELFEKFYSQAAQFDWEEKGGFILNEKETTIRAKACARISVEEIIVAQDTLFKDGNKDSYLSFRRNKQYWNEVLTHLQ